MKTNNNITRSKTLSLPSEQPPNNQKEGGGCGGRNTVTTNNCTILYRAGVLEFYPFCKEIFYLSCESRRDWGVKIWKEMQIPCLVDTLEGYAKVAYMEEIIFSKMLKLAFFFLSFLLKPTILFLKDEELAN